MNYKKDFYENCKSGNLQAAKLAASQTDVEDMVDACFLESAITGHTEITSYLVETFSIDIHQSNERALKNACSFQNYQTVSYLMSKGAKIESDNYSAFKSLVDNYKTYKAENRVKNPDQYLELYTDLYEKVKETFDKDEMIEWSSSKAHTDIVKDLISVADLTDKSVLDNLVNNSIASNSDLLGDLIQNKNLLQKNKLDIILWAIAKHENTKVYDLIDYQGNDFQGIIEKTFEHNNIEILKSLVEHKKIPNSFYIITLCKSYEAYTLVAKEVKHSQYESYLKFIELDRISIAFEMLKEGFEIPEPKKQLSKDECYRFPQDNKLPSFYDPLEISDEDDDEDYYFTPESKLPPFYTPLDPKGREGVSYILLYNANTDLIEEIIKKRESLFLQDHTIIQFLIEQEYEYNNLILTALRALVAENINLEMDTQGYLIQIAAFLEEKDLIDNLSKLGSDITRFLERYKDSANWLNSEGFKELNEQDYNNDRSYNVYKKFDERNTIEPEMIELCETIRMKVYLNNTLEESEQHKAVKI